MPSPLPPLPEERGNGGSRFARRRGAGPSPLPPLPEERGNGMSFATWLCNGEGRNDRDAGRGGGDAAERNVSREARERPCRARAHLGKDAHALHQDSAGDKVTVELTPYDLSRARITFRAK